MPEENQITTILEKRIKNIKVGSLFSVIFLIFLNINTIQAQNELLEEPQGDLIDSFTILSYNLDFQSYVGDDKTNVPTISLYDNTEGTTTGKYAIVYFHDELINVVPHYDSSTKVFSLHYHAYMMDNILKLLEKNVPLRCYFKKQSPTHFWAGIITTKPFKR